MIVDNDENIIIDFDGLTVHGDSAWSFRNCWLNKNYLILGR